MNKYPRNMILSFILALTGFIPLSYAHDSATDNRVYIQLAEVEWRSVRCGRGESLAACKQRHGDYRFKSKQKHQHHSKHKQKAKHKHKSKNKNSHN